MIDKQTDRMNQSLMTDLANVKDTYNNAVNDLDKMYDKLANLFKQKVFKVKSKVAEYFANVEIKFK